MSTMTLGELINRLKEICDVAPNAVVRFGFGYHQPTNFPFHSYRGDYSHLAIEYARGVDDKITARTFHKSAKLAVGKTFTGYKGGDYVMTLSTPVWVALRGEAPSTGIKGITLWEGDELAVIDTSYMPYEG